MNFMLGILHQMIVFVKLVDGVNSVLVSGKIFYNYNNVEILLKII